MRANWLEEIVKRAQRGPFMKENEFDLKMIKLTRDLVKEFSIEYDPKKLVSDDDGFADRLNEVGLQLFIDQGAYCQSTERTIIRNLPIVDSTLHESLMVSEEPSYGSHHI